MIQKLQYEGMNGQDVMLKKKEPFFSPSNIGL
jgi:hypothetical protein